MKNDTFNEGRKSVILHKIRHVFESCSRRLYAKQNDRKMFPGVFPLFFYVISYPDFSKCVSKSRKAATRIEVDRAFSKDDMSEKIETSIMQVSSKPK